MELDQISGLLICFPLASDQEPRKKNKLKSLKEYQNICQQRPKHSFSHAPFLDNTGAELRALKGVPAVCFKISWTGNTCANVIHLAVAGQVWSPPVQASLHAQAEAASSSPGCRKPIWLSQMGLVIRRHWDLQHWLFHALHGEPAGPAMWILRLPTLAQT